MFFPYRNVPLRSTRLQKAFYLQKIIGVYKRPTRVSCPKEVITSSYLLPMKELLGSSIYRRTCGGILYATEFQKAFCLQKSLRENSLCKKLTVAYLAIYTTFWGLLSLKDVLDFFSISYLFRTPFGIFYLQKVVIGFFHLQNTFKEVSILQKF